MERKTRSGKLVAAPPPPAPPPAPPVKKKGRPRKSDVVQETAVKEPEQPKVKEPEQPKSKEPEQPKAKTKAPTRRSLRGRKLSQSASETSLVENEDSNASFMTVTDTETSTIADESSVLEPPVQNEEIKEEFPGELSESKLTEAANISFLDPVVKIEKIEISKETEKLDEEMLEEAKTCDESVKNLEKQIKEVTLNEEKESIFVEDVEMKEEFEKNSAASEGFQVQVSEVEKSEVQDVTEDPKEKENEDEAMETDEILEIPKKLDKNVGNSGKKSGKIMKSPEKLETSEKNPENLQILEKSEEDSEKTVDTTEKTVKVVEKSGKKSEKSLKITKKSARISGKFESLEETSMETLEKLEKSEKSSKKSSKIAEKSAKIPEKTLKSPEKFIESPEKSLKSPEKFLETPEKFLESSKNFEKLSIISEKVENTPDTAMRFPEQSTEIIQNTGKTAGKSEKSVKNLKNLEKVSKIAEKVSKISEKLSKNSEKIENSSETAMEITDTTETIQNAGKSARKSVKNSEKVSKNLDKSLKISEKPEKFSEKIENSPESAMEISQESTEIIQNTEKLSRKTEKSVKNSEKIPKNLEKLSKVSEKSAKISEKSEKVLEKFEKTLEKVENFPESALETSEISKEIIQNAEKVGKRPVKNSKNLDKLSKTSEKSKNQTLKSFEKIENSPETEMAMEISEQSTENIQNVGKSSRKSEKSLKNSEKTSKNLDKSLKNLDKSGKSSEKIENFPEIAMEISEFSENSEKIFEKAVKNQENSGKFFEKFGKSHEKSEKSSEIIENLPENPIEIPEKSSEVTQSTEKPSEIPDNPELMDIDDSKFVRRSRRLQSIYLDPPVKDEIAPVPPPDDKPVQPVSPATEVKSLDPPLGPPEIVVQKPVINTDTRVPHTDERLKRYETIRDNIYSKKSDKKVCKVNKTMKCDCTITEEEVKNGELGCTFNCINRLLYIECGPKCRCGEYCDNQQFQRYNYADCSVFDTKIKGFGIRANVNIPAETFIIEYVGEVLDNKQFEKRAKKYSENKNTHYYFMALKSNAIIDATKKGNISRFINHSCDPNAETQKWTINGELRVGFFSRKDVKAGEEITFDYQYQRYGKEAQKCYCGADSCRGWIGENPLDDEGEEEEIVEEETAKAKKTKTKKGRKPKVAAETETETTAELSTELEVKEESVSEEESPKVAVKKREIVRKPPAKKKQFDDLEIEGEINELTESGLKNRMQTIKLSRLVVRAKNVQARSRLLKILINGDLPCRRLFLDYNGLKLLHQWMSDINVKASTDDLALCVEMMNALERLPIFNKTVLRTSKVLDRVEKWKNLDLEKKKMTKEEKKQAKADKKKKELEKIEEVAKEPMDISQPMDELTKMKVEAKRVASELLTKWEGLQEDFKIPKKLKQENRIEHEREIDWDNENVVQRDSLTSDRFKNRFGEDSGQPVNRSFQAPYKKHSEKNVSKQQRRQMFEMKVQQFDTEKRMMMLHENNCAIFGLNPNTTNPLDVPVRVNRVTGEYITIDGRIAPPPPNHYQFKYEPLTLSTNPDDYHLPPIDLPEHWRFALDSVGRIYYYHDKIRVSQWEAPIKILPLKMNDESDLESSDSDESTTDTQDSEEEELRELLEMLKRKKLLPPVQSTPVNPLVIQGNEGDEDELEKKIMNNMIQNPVEHPLKLSQAPQKRLNRKKRHGLATTQFIRPRTEADKIYGRAESRRYKEVKEKLRQKKRRILKGEAAPGDGSSEDEDDITLGDTVGKLVDELDILEKSKLGGMNKMKKDAEKKLKKPKPVVLDQAEIKRQFRDEIKREIAKFLQPYKEESCEKGRITNDVDFASLVNKLTFSVLTKESKHCQSTNSILKATESVKGKTKEYIKKYMGKFEGPYQRKEDEQDYATILNKL